jgi:alpha-mannosidase
VGLPSPREALDAIWRTCNPAVPRHPAGTSIKKVYDDSTAMYIKAFDALNGLCREAEAVLTRGLDGVTLVNTLSETRDDIALFEAPEGATHLQSADGRLFPIQRTGNGCAAFVKGLPAMSGSFHTFSSGVAAKSGLSVSREGFETPFFSGKFDSAMRISSLVMKPTGREVCRPGEALNRLVCYEDKPYQFDAWELNIYYPRKSWEVDELISVAVVESGPVRATLRVEWRYQRSTIRQDIRFYQDIGRIDFDTTADWRESQTLVKAHFPVDVFYNEATYDVQFGNLRRPTHKNTSWDVARFEVAAQKWADVSEDGFGVSLLNDCKYGHSVDERSMALTLLRCAVHPNPEADKEVHQFSYALYPHEGDWRDAGTPSMAYRQNEPVKAVEGTRLESFAAWTRRTS